MLEHPVSGHLDSEQHYYDNGTTARLKVDTWTRDTVADGAWQTTYTIQPLINRDIYLADAIDKIAEQYVDYRAGQGIIKTPNADGSFTLSVDVDYFRDNTPHYIFDEKYFLTSYLPEQEGIEQIDVKLNTTGFISADNDGLYCNVEGLINSTTALSSFSSISANTCSSLSYDYKVSALAVTFVESIPAGPLTPDQNLYIVG